MTPPCPPAPGREPRISTRLDARRSIPVAKGDDDLAGRNDLGPGARRQYETLADKSDDDGVPIGASRQQSPQQAPLDPR